MGYNTYALNLSITLMLRLQHKKNTAKAAARLAATKPQCLNAMTAALYKAAVGGNNGR